MLYHDACRYAHLFLYEYKRRFEPYYDDLDAPYIKPIDRYSQIIDSVLRYGNIPLGDYGYISRYSDELITEIIKRITNYYTYTAPDILCFREIVYIVLEKTLLSYKTTGITNPRNTLQKAVDKIIPSHL